MNGTLRAHVEQKSGGSVVTDLIARPPLAAKILYGVAGGPELILVGSAAALLEGDRLHVFLTLEPGTTLTVRSTAATLAHPCPGGGSTLSTVTAVVGAGAALAWLPEALVACAGCRHRSASTLRLEQGAAAVWYEACTLGRSGEIAGEVNLRLDVTLGGAPLLRDGFRGEAGASPAVLGGRRHLGNIHLLGKRLAVAPPGGPPALFPEVWKLAGPGATARCVATDAAELSRALHPARERFLAALHGPSPHPFDPSPSTKEALVHD